MKKIISIAAAAAMSFSMAAAVNAENNPSVYVDGTKIAFADQAPVILGEGTTLVPARGVFEAMGADVQWDEANRRVTIESEDNIKRIFLTIDDPDMTTWTFTSIFHADEATVKLDIAPQIINDRTMIPLRAISEAMGADVQWDPDAYSVIITTADYEEYTPPEDVNIPSDKTVKTGMSVTSSVDSVSAGDTVDIYVNVSNMPANAYLSGVTALVSYNKDDFEYVGSSLCRKSPTTEGVIIDVPAAVQADNPEYLDSAAKAVIATLEDTIAEPGAAARLTFKAKTNNGGDFALVNSYETLRGYDNTFTFTQSDSGKLFQVSGDDLYLDTTPIKISGK